MNLSFHLVSHFSLMILLIVLLIIGIVEAHQNGVQWLKKHQGIVLSGVSLGIIGFLIMFINKQINGYPHFLSTHSKFGLLALILSVLTPVLGVLILKQILKMKWIHKLLGVCTLLAGLAAAGFRISLFLG